MNVRQFVTLSAVMLSPVAWAGDTQAIINKLQKQIQGVQASIPALIGKQAKVTNQEMKNMQKQTNAAMKDLQKQIVMVQANMQQNLEKQAQNSRTDLVRTRHSLQSGMQKLAKQIQDLSKRS